ncbi:MAG: hypothetical protein ABIO44_09120 [Saprospiraceae bacterium]
MINFLAVGKTFKTHGVKGELEINIEDEFLELIEKEKIVFIYVNGNPVPYWIQSIREESRMFCRFEEVDNPELARNLSNKTIFADQSRIPKKILKRLDGREDMDSLESYTLHDLTSGITSVIVSIQEFPSQILAELNIEDHKIMIPLHEDFIENIDKKNKIITLTLPEGMFDLS